MASLIGSADAHRDRAAIAFFGIRGMGSFYYLAYTVTAAGIEDAGELWATVTLVVVLLILVHGISAQPILRNLERQAPDNDPVRVAARPRASLRGGDHPMRLE
jgi:NhaP-type Na+/H+ or K+/H+ antiporter